MSYQHHNQALITSLSAVASALLLGVSSIGCEGYDGPHAGTDEAAEATDDVDVQIAELLAQHPAAERISHNEIAWNDGAVVLSLPEIEPVSELGQSEKALCIPGISGCQQGCPPGFYCFYQDKNFEGRMLKFSDCSPSGTTQFLHDYGFDRLTTSWVVNRNLSVVNVYDGNGGFLWSEANDSLSSHVGTAIDLADEFVCFS